MGEGWGRGGDRQLIVINGYIQFTCGSEELFSSSLVHTGVAVSDSSLGTNCIDASVPLLESSTC